MVDMSHFTLTKHDPELVGMIALAEHHVLAQWAIDCLERILPVFEERFPGENTPWQAVDILQDWMDGAISMWQARKYCWTVLKRAREIEGEDKACCQILRAASHCLATCHVPTHAEGTAMYVVSALQHLYHGREDAVEQMRQEREWQIRQLAERVSPGGDTVRQNGYETV